MKTTDEYIIEQFLLVHAPANVHVELDDDTIRVVVSYADTVHHYSMHMSDDDYEYRFVNDIDDTDDTNADVIEFPFMSFIVIPRSDLPAAIISQCEFVADLIRPERLAYMMTDDDDYVPAAMSILTSLLAAKFDNVAEIEIDVSELPYDDALPPDLLERVKR